MDVLSVLFVLAILLLIVAVATTAFLTFTLFRLSGPVPAVPAGEIKPPPKSVQSAAPRAHEPTIKPMDSGADDTNLDHDYTNLDDVAEPVSGLDDDYTILDAEEPDVSGLDADMTLLGAEDPPAPIGYRIVEGLAANDQLQALPAQPQFNIGRTVNLDKQVLIPLDDSNISRTHAAIRVDNGRYYLRDLNSSNGTHIKMADNEFRRLAQGEEILLHDGDHVRFGSKVVLAFALPPQPDDVPPAPGEPVDDDMTIL